VIAYDPLAIPNVRTIFNDNISYVSSAAECISKGQVCVVTTTCSEFKVAVEGYRAEDCITVIDCWRIIDKQKLVQHIRYVPWGYYDGEIAHTRADKVSALVVAEGL
jgi:hypothetical protein